jgi:hypothetical protein
MPGRGKYWCFTLNNYTEEEKKLVSDAVEHNEDITYVCFGIEKGETGTPHLQGYMEFKQRIRLGAIKRIGGFKRVHLELRQGTAAQAKAYCEKDGEFFEFGVLKKSQQGKRSDLLAVKDLIDGGADEAKVAEEHFGAWVRYRKSFSAYRNLVATRQSVERRVYVLYGEPGTGKTRFVFENEPSLWIANDPTLQWFDGYRGEESVLLDDYRGDGNPAFLLRLLDRYPLQVPVKGGFVPWVPKRIFITSNLEPPFGHLEITEPLRRRIRRVMHLYNKLNFDDREMMETFKESLYQ